MKALNIDAARRLYHAKCKPSALEGESQGKCNVLMYSIGMSMLSLAFSTPGEPIQESLLRRIAAQIADLHDLEREAAFISGFHAAVEMMTKEVQNHAA